VSEGDEDRLWRELGELLDPLKAAAAEEAPCRPKASDGRSKRASFRRWLAKHQPLTYVVLAYPPDGSLIERKRRAEIERRARVLRDANACCIDCHQPLIAAETGFQYCPYERAGQHEKTRVANLKALSGPFGAEKKAPQVALCGCRSIPSTAGNQA
jgi:hypothetical protein